MIGFRRFRFALLLALGVLVLSGTPALSNRDIASQQIVPDSEGDLFLVSTGGGHHRPDGIIQEPQKPTGVSPTSGASFPEVAWILRDLLKSVWLTTWKTGILP